MTSFKAMGKLKNLQTLRFNNRKWAKDGPKIKEHIKVIYGSIYCKMVCILYDSPLPKMREEMALSLN